MNTPEFDQRLNGLIDRLTVKQIDLNSDLSEFHINFVYDYDSIRQTNYISGLRSGTTDRALFATAIKNLHMREKGMALAAFAQHIMDRLDPVDEEAFEDALKTFFQANTEFCPHLSKTDKGFQGSTCNWCGARFA